MLANKLNQEKTNITRTIKFCAIGVLSLWVAGGAYGQTPSVCQRTTQVQAAIVAAIDGVSACAEVTSAHLRTITTLDLSDRDITQLRADDFNGLTLLLLFDLSSNQLQTLPDIFDSLTNLSALSLSGNQLETLDEDILTV